VFLFLLAACVLSQCLLQRFEEVLQMVLVLVLVLEAADSPWCSPVALLANT
jgi:hypothetical protein